MYDSVHSAYATPFDVLAVTASAGGIPALMELLGGLPRDFPASVLIVQHLPAFRQHRSKLAEILRRSTALRVKWAEDGELLASGTVYVAPQDRHTVVKAGRLLSLSSGPKVNGFRPAADPLFISVAAEFAARAVCVVLTGALSDGAMGAEAIADAGGRVLTQDKSSSWMFSMPEATIRTGRVDFTFPLAVLSYALIALFMVPGAAQWFRVAKLLPPITGQTA